MTTSLEELVERLESDNVNTQGLALGELIRRGNAATPILIEALQNAKPGVRALAAEGLGRIGDLNSANSLVAALQDSDEEVRSRAAAALAHLEDPRALPALISTLDDNYDLLHADLSLSAYTLSGFGPEALPAVAPLLKADNESIRAQAIWIIRQIVSNMMSEEVDWTELWQSLGAYDPEGPADTRNQAAERWIAWIETRGG